MHLHPSTSPVAHRPPTQTVPFRLPRFLTTAVPTSSHHPHHARCLSLLTALLNRNLLPSARILLLRRIAAHYPLPVASTIVCTLIKLDSLPPDAAYDVLLRALCAKDHFLKAHRLFISMVKKNNSSLVPSQQSALNVLIPGLCSNGQLDDARQVFEIMLGSGVQPTVHLYRSLIYGFCRKNRTVEAERMLGEMECYQLFPDLRMYTAVMQRFCEEGEMNSALELFERMGKHKGCCRPDASVYSRLIHGFLNNGDFDTARKLFTQMLTRGFVPDGLLVFCMIDSHCRNNKLDCACVIVQIMVMHRLKLDAGCYTALICTFCRENRLEEAGRWFDKMLEAGLIPDKALFISLLKSHRKNEVQIIVQKVLLALAKKGFTINISVFSRPGLEEMLQREAEVMSDMIAGNKVAPVDMAFSVLIHALLCIYEKAYLALFFMDKMATRGCRVSVFTYNSILRCLYKDRLMEDPAIATGLMQKWGILPNMSTYLIMVDACCKHGDIDCAFGTFGHMIKRGFRPTVAIYDSVIGALCRERRIQEAEDMFHNMLKSGVQADEVVYTTLLSGYSKFGRVVDACSLFEEMVNEGLQPNLHSYSALINVLVKRNMFNKACRYLEEMLSKGLLPDTTLYTMLISQFSRKGEVGFAFSLYDLMVRDQVEPNLITVGSLISGACRSILNRGRVDPLLARKLNETTHNLFQLLPQRTVIGKLDQGLSFRSLNGKFDEVIDILRYINGNRLAMDLYIYNGVINFFCTTHKLDDSLDIVDSMLEDHIIPNHVTYTILMKGYIRASEIDRAVEAFNLMNKQGYFPDKVTYNTLIKGLCIAGRGDAALALVHMMQKRGFLPDRISYNTLVEFFCSSYSSDIAFKLFGEMIDHGYIPRHRSCNILFWILIQEEKLWEARIILVMILKRGRIPDPEAKKQLMEMFSR